MFDFSLFFHSETQIFPFYKENVLIFKIKKFMSFTGFNTLNASFNIF